MLYYWLALSSLVLLCIINCEQFRCRKTIISRLSASRGTRAHCTNIEYIIIIIIIIIKLESLRAAARGRCNHCKAVGRGEETRVTQLSLTLNNSANMICWRK